MTKKMNQGGVNCRCGAYHPFGGWVYAHWRTRLIFTCPDCGSTYTVIMGTYKLKKKGRNVNVKIKNR